MSTTGSVIWITGLSGSGKTTLARMVKQELDENGICSVLVDGDDVREMVGDKACGYDRKNRLINAYRISRLCRMLSKQGLVVIAATISLFREIHQWNETHFPEYKEVLLTASLEILKKRDKKKIYEGIRHIAGVTQDVDYPVTPHFIVDNNAGLNELVSSAQNIAKQVIYGKSSRHTFNIN